MVTWLCKVGKVCGTSAKLPETICSYHHMFCKDPRAPNFDGLHLMARFFVLSSRQLDFYFVY